MSAQPRFHLAIAVDDLAEARVFYGDVLNCPEGRSSPSWIDFDLGGHQLVVHLSKEQVRAAEDCNAVDGQGVPVPHFGLVLSIAAFHRLADRIRNAGRKFVIEPRVRFEGLPGEQWTMFFRDPAGNALEFKAFANIEALFAAQEPNA